MSAVRRDGAKFSPADSFDGSLSHPGDARLKWIAFGTAVAIHLFAMFISFPEMRKALTPIRPHSAPIVVKHYVPPPPEIEPRRSAVSKKKLARRVPIPDPTPDDPEPIREPEPEFAYNATPGDVDLLIGTPGPPGPPGPVGRGASGEPLLAGVGGATRPVRIEESYVKPTYPEMARAARQEANVVLQAVIHCDGTVGETVVLRCTQPGFGFEDAAITAVRQWHYLPATQYGRPVDVYFTILVEFTLV